MNNQRATSLLAGLDVIQCHTAKRKHFGMMVHSTMNFHFWGFLHNLLTRRHLWSNESSHIHSGTYGDASGSTLEAVTYVGYKTILSLYDRLRRNKGMDYSGSYMQGSNSELKPLHTFTSIFQSSALWRLPWCVCTSQAWHNWKKTSKHYNDSSR